MGDNRISARLVAATRDQLLVEVLRLRGVIAQWEAIAARDHGWLIETVEEPRVAEDLDRDACAKCGVEVVP